MQFGAADAIDLGTAFRAGPENDSAAALVETGGGILDLTLRLAFYTISFHCYLQVCKYKKFKGFPFVISVYQNFPL